jgi:hypothetical protein
MSGSKAAIETRLRSNASSTCDMADFGWHAHAFDTTREARMTPTSSSSDLEADVHADQRQKEAERRPPSKCFAPDMP